MNRSIEENSFDSSAEYAAASARRWLGVAIGALLLAGLFALLLVLGRMPPFDRLVSDPLIFKRFLVVHVTLALVFWFYAYTAGLFALLPSTASRSGLWMLGGPVATVGVVMVMAAAAIDGAEPILSNYIPVIDHPLFLGGLIAFGVGLALSFMNRRLLPGAEVEEGIIPAAARPGLRAAAICVLLALATFVGSAIATDSFLAPEARYELLFWGGGHVLQFASEAAMLSVWLILLASYLGYSPIRRNTAALLFAFLVLPVLIAPLLALQGSAQGFVRGGFTRMMEFGIFPVATTFLVLCVAALRKAARNGRFADGGWKDVRLLGFGISAGLTVLGFSLGFLIRGPNTMVPAHYHASIGGVTAAFMAVSYVLLVPLGFHALEKRKRLMRLATWQPVLFGVGQMVFAVGFGLAGMSGAARKVYGAEQASREGIEALGLFVMGVGGLVAVAGGLVFLSICSICLFERLREKRVTVVLTPTEGAYEHD